MKRYFRNLFVAIDQLVSALLGYDPDETLSSIAGKRNNLWEKIINKLFFWQPNHCDKSVEVDEGKDSIR